MGKAQEYIKKELEQKNSDLYNIEKAIHSCDIELNTIKSKIKQINKSEDETESILHSVTISNNPGSDCLMLNSAIEEVRKKQDELEKEKKNLNIKIKELEDILKADETLDNNSRIVSRETNNDDYLSAIRIDELNKQRISRDIHDSVIQNLTALIHKQEFIQQLINKDINRATIELNNSKNVIREIIDDLRNLIYNLRPMSFDDLGFITSFMDVCENIKNESEDMIVSYNVKSNSDKNIEEYKLDSTIGMAIIRIIRELSSNSLKHSQGKEISIELLLEDNNITIHYMDDGIGFDFNHCEINKANNTGYGMVMLRERVNILNGTIEYNNDNGSEFFIIIPIYS